MNKYFFVLFDCCGTWKTQLGNKIHLNGLTSSFTPRKVLPSINQA
jgi:hypothetical protein